MNGQKKGKEGERIRIEINCKINLKKKRWLDGKVGKTGTKKKKEELLVVMEALAALGAV